MWHTIHRPRFLHITSLCLYQRLGSLECPITYSVKTLDNITLHYLRHYLLDTIVPPFFRSSDHNGCGPFSQFFCFVGINLYYSRWIKQVVFKNNLNDHIPPDETFSIFFWISRTVLNYLIYKFVKVIYVSYCALYILDVTCVLFPVTRMSTPDHLL